MRDELGLYGFVVAADALAQMIFSPIFGVVSDRLGQIRIVSLVCAATFTIGNVMYALASLVPQDLWGIHIPRLWFVLATRFIVGVGTCKDSSNVLMQVCVNWIREIHENPADVFRQASGVTLMVDALTATSRKEEIFFSTRPMYRGMCAVRGLRLKK